MHPAPPHPQSKPLALCALLSVAMLAGCSAEMGATDAPSASSTAADGPASSPDATTGTDSASTEPAVVPSWYAVSGALTVFEGAATLDGIEVSFFDAAEAPACTVSFVPGDLVDEPPPEGEPLHTWWSVDLSSAQLVEGDCSGVPTEDWSLTFGAGDYDPRLDPSLLASGLDGTNGYGMYLQEAPEEPVWVLGVVASDSQQQGLEAADPDGLVDGTYDILPLLLLEWSP